MGPCRQPGGALASTDKSENPPSNNQMIDRYGSCGLFYFYLFYFYGASAPEKQLWAPCETGMIILSNDGIIGSTV